MCQHSVTVGSDKVASHAIRVLTFKPEIMEMSNNLWPLVAKFLLDDVVCFYLLKTRVIALISVKILDMQQLLLCPTCLT